MFKVVVSDLDGTLLNSDGIITDYTKKVIKLLNKNNIYFIIATGRHYLDVVDVFKNSNIDLFKITANGSVAHDNKNKLIYYKKINSDIVLYIIKKYFLDKNIFVNIFCNNLWIVNPNSNLNRNYVKKINYEDLINDKNIINNTCKIHINSKNINYLTDVKEKINSYCKDYIDINFSLPFCVEINPINVSKGNTLKFILEKIKLSLNDCISFGDGMNDLNMLKITNKACLMKNSSYELKNKLPNLEIIDSNDNNGVAKYIENNLINN